MSPAVAQTIPSAGQLTPRSFEPQSSPQKPIYSLPSTEYAGVAPPGAENARLNVGEVVLEGGDPELAERAHVILAEVQGRELPASAFYEAAAKVQQLYSNEGYFLIRIVIPPQNAENGGVLRLKVVDGFIASVDVEAVAPQVKQRVAKTLAGLIGKRHLKRVAFDRALLLAADTAGLELKSNLAPAQADAGVVLTVAGAYRPVSAQVSSDNSLSHSLGTYTSTLSGSANSVLGFGEQLYIVASGAPNNGFLDDTSPRRLVAAGATVPIGYDGLSSNLEYAWLTTMPQIAPGQLQTDSNFERLSFKLSYPFIKTENSTLVAHFGFDATDEINHATGLNAVLYDDSLRTLRGSIDLNQNLVSGTTVGAGIDLSQGIRGLGSRGTSDATASDPVSQTGASDQYTKLAARILVYQNLPQGFALEISGRGQYAATGALMNSEKFTLGGPNDLSGYDASSLTGDHGWLLRGELQYNYQTQWLGISSVFRPYLFAARGEVFTINPTAVEFSVNGADSFGFGVRWALPLNYTLLRQVDLAVEGARQLSDNLTAAPNLWRLNFSGSVRF